MYRLFLFMLTESTVLLSQVSPAIDPISGGAGWLGAGLLGLVLGWYLLIRTPASDRQLKELLQARDAQFKEIMDAKDCQLKELLTANDSERDRERKARHDVSDKANEMVIRTTKTFEVALVDIKDQHRKDAESDRDAFMARQSELKDCIEKQTTVLVQKMQEQQIAMLAKMSEQTGAIQNAMTKICKSQQ